MIKLWRYLKRYWAYILVIIGLLYVNAQTELALPDYMSRIISVGIQAGGIEDGVMEAIDPETYMGLELFMNENDKSIFEDAYVLMTQQNLSDKIKNRYKNCEDIYLLQELSDEQYTALNDVIYEPLLLHYMFSQASNSDEFKEAMTNIPQGMDIYQFIATLSSEQLETMKANMLQKVENMGDSVSQIAIANAVKMIYTDMGRDIDEIQMTYIFNVGFEMLGIALIGTLAFITVTFLASKVAAMLSRVLRNEVFSHVSHFGNYEINRFSTASLITRTTNDIQQIQMVITMMLRVVIYAPIVGIGAIIRVMENGAGMTWIIVMTLCILLLVIAITFSIVLPKFKIVQKTVDKLNLVMRENLTGMMVIRAFGNQKESSKRFDQANQDMTKLNLFVNRVMNSVMPLMMFILNCVSLLIIWVGGHQIDLGYTNIGNMMAFIQYSMNIIMSFVMIAMIFVMLPRASVACSRVFEILETEPMVQNPKAPVHFDETKTGIVEFDHVSFAYPGAKEEVLHDISFTAYPGKTTAIIGSTGSGKSTLIQLIPRFYDATKGQIRVDGVDVKKVNIESLRDKLGLVLQKGVLFSGTIESNLRFGNENVSLQEVEDASRIAQAEDFILAKQDGYETLISQGGTNVSGGQKQRLAIARAIVKDPEVYIFDDSFSALDFKTDAKLRKELNQMIRQKQRTVIIVGQRISTIMNADEIIVLNDGCIVGKGTHAELMKNCEVYQEIAYSQLSKEELANG